MNSSASSRGCSADNEMSCLRVYLCEDTREQGVVQWLFRECEVIGHCTHSPATDFNIYKDRLNEFAAETFCVKHQQMLLQTSV